MTAHAGRVHGWDDGVDADVFADVAGKVRSAMAETDERLTAALDEIRHRRDVADGVVWLSSRERRIVQNDVPRLLAAIGRALELTDPLRNPTLGGTFLGAVGIQVREAILAELEDGPR
jgi:hypothetical protein